MAEQRIETGSISPLGRRLWWLIAGRAAAVVLLFLGAAAWRWNASAPAPGNAIIDVLPIIVSIAALTIIYCIARIAWKNYAAQASIQFFLDIVLVTWLVWITGHARSPYAALYIVIISVASLYVGPRGAMRSAHSPVEHVPYLADPSRLATATLQAIVPAALLEEWNGVVVGHEGEVLTVALAQPSAQAVEEISRATGLAVYPVYSTAANLEATRRRLS